jgi:hypothetical protein
LKAALASFNFSSAKRISWPWLLSARTADPAATISATSPTSGPTSGPSRAGSALLTSSISAHLRPSKRRKCRRKVSRDHEKAHAHPHIKKAPVRQVRDHIHARTDDNTHTHTHTPFPLCNRQGLSRTVTATETVRPFLEVRLGRCCKYGWAKRARPYQ